MPLEYGDATRLEMGDAFRVDIRANHLMSRFGETRAGHKTNIATANYRDSQASSPECSPAAHIRPADLNLNFLL